MKAYLSVPMVMNRSLDRAKLMAEAIETAGYELASPWVIGPKEHHDSTVLNVFLRDKNGAEGSDVLVADVSAPSTGVGMEIMAAYMAGKPIVLLARRGVIVSRMLEHMERKVIVEYDDEDSIVPKLTAALVRVRE